MVCIHVIHFLYVTKDNNIIIELILLQLVTRSYSLKSFQYVCQHLTTQVLDESNTICYAIESLQSS